MSTTDELPTPPVDDSGRVIADRYRLLERVGHGGMAEVFRAQDQSLGRDVALKIFRRELASAEDLRRQEVEVRLLAGLSHPSLVTLFDATSDGDGRGVLVLEYVKGSDARDRLKDGPLPGPVVAAIGLDIANALAYIHSQGVVHRDISPANILLPESLSTGVAAKLTDLGIARLVDDTKITATGSVMGTASYMSPEQALGRPLTGRSDVYSLGLVLLECLTGRREFPGTVAESAAARLTRDPAVPATLDPRWSALLAAMTAREPEQRPAPEAVATQLRALLDQDAWVGDIPDPSDLPTARMDTPTHPVSAGTGPTLLLPTSEREDVPATGPTQVLSSSDREEVSAAAPTQVLPTSDRDDASATVPLTERPAAAPAVERSARRPSRRRILDIALAVDAVVAVIAIILAAVTLSTADRSVPDPVTSYPAVDGTLGDHLKQLEDQVSRDWTP
ncbi:serine/threonine-protein kinase [Leifsonia sp. NPDC077715]|uniref:serine/threonine-protein kinase n=1 Tax=Leifsonia sp. NPDC077715 TaxID=3155539 RepID=UPI00341EAABD